MSKVASDIGHILSKSEKDARHFKPLQATVLRSTSDFPRLLNPPKEYWPLISKPGPDLLNTPTPRHSDYGVIVDYFSDIIPGEPDKGNAIEGSTENIGKYISPPRGETSLRSTLPEGTSLISESTGAPDNRPRMSRDADSWTESLIGISTRRTSIPERQSYEDKNLDSIESMAAAGPVLEEAEQFPTSSKGYDVDERTRNMANSRETIKRTRRQIVKERLIAWKLRVKLRFSTIIRFKYKSYR
jgi:hypothetical protein